MGGGELPIWGDSLFPSKGAFFPYPFLFKIEIALFSNLYMRTMAPGRRQKAAKVKPDLRMKDALLIKLASCSCREATHMHAGADTG